MKEYCFALRIAVKAVNKIDLVFTAYFSHAFTYFAAEKPTVKKSLSWTSFTYLYFVLLATIKKGWSLKLFFFHFVL